MYWLPPAPLLIRTNFPGVPRAGLVTPTYRGTATSESPPQPPRPLLRGTPPLPPCHRPRATYTTPANINSRGSEKPITPATVVAVSAVTTQSTEAPGELLHQGLRRHLGLPASVNICLHRSSGLPPDQHPCHRPQPIMGSLPPLM